MSAKSYRPSNLYFVLIAVLLLFLMLGCAPCFSWYNGNNNNTTTGSVKGSCYIITNEGKQPVGNLTVTVGSKTITSNKDSSFEITGLNPGTYDVRVFGGDLGYSGKATIKAGETTDLGELQLHGTLPPPNTDTEKYPTTPEGVIRAYYKAINEQDYSKALSYTTGNLAKMELDAIRGQYEPYVKNIQVVLIKRWENADIGNEQMYEVTFQADYIKHYAAGSGNLQEFHTLLKTDNGWKITGMGTGP